MLKFKVFHADTHVVSAYLSSGLMQDVLAYITYPEMQLRDSLPECGTELRLTQSQRLYPSLEKDYHFGRCFISVSDAARFRGPFI